LIETFLFVVFSASIQDSSWGSLGPWDREEIWDFHWSVW